LQKRASPGPIQQVDAAGIGIEVLPEVGYRSSLLPRRQNARSIHYLLPGHDGRGVQLLDTSQPPALGLLGMQERAQSLGGEATVTTRPTGGALVWARVPVQ
jgi:hypothetical protein